MGGACSRVVLEFLVLNRELRASSCEQVISLQFVAR